jgi:hypothetical protein
MIINYTMDITDVILSAHADGIITEEQCAEVNRRLVEMINKMASVEAAKNTFRYHDGGGTEHEVDVTTGVGRVVKEDTNG